MKIAILITAFGTTGIEVTMQRLANGLRRAGASIDLVVMSGQTRDHQPPIDADIRVIDLRASRLWLSLPAIVKYIRRERPTAVIAAGPLANGFAGLAKRLSGGTTPVILTEHSLNLFGFADGASVGRKLLRAFLTRGYREADAVVGVSRGVADELRKLPYLDPQRIHVIYNPVWSQDLVDRSRQDPNHRWLSEESTIPVILSVGRMDTFKGFDNLIRAFALVRQTREARLIILGEGDQRSSLEQLACDLGVRDAVDMPGFVERPERFMSRAAVFALSARMEALGVVFIEALACGTPIVSTDCPTGPREVLGDSTYGLLVPVDEPAALAAALLAKLTDAGDRQVLRNRAMEFSEDAAVRKYLALINGVCAGHRREDAGFRATRNAVAKGTSAVTHGN